MGGIGAGGQPLTHGPDEWRASLPGENVKTRRHAARCKLDPFVLGGFSLVGPTFKGGGRGGPPGNFGGGANLWLNQHATLRFEVRDVIGSSFWQCSNQVSFRVGVTFR